MHGLTSMSRVHHQVVLANLQPIEVDEMDSYMYQTVGHEVIELIAEVRANGWTVLSADSMCTNACVCVRGYMWVGGGVCVSVPVPVSVWVWVGGWVSVRQRVVLRLLQHAKGRLTKLC